jgi:nucleoside phosphorylase
VTYSSDVCICFSALLEEVVSYFTFTKELTELKESDLDLLNEPQEAVARGMKSPNAGPVLTGKSFWLFSESISHCRRTCVSIPASEHLINKVNFIMNYVSIIRL